MKILGLFFRSVGAIGSLGIFSLTIHGSNQSPSSLVKEWVEAKPEKTITGVYANRCSIASEPAIAYTGLLSIVLNRSEMNKIQIKSAIKHVELIQSEKQIRVTAVDVAGALIVTRVLDEGRDYQTRGPEVVIPENWNAGDEWGSAEGTTVNSLVKTKDGHLLVKSTNRVKRRTFLVPTRGETNYYFKFDEAEKPLTPGG
jgi:hypothetical protein